MSIKKFIPYGVVAVCLICLYIAFPPTKVDRNVAHYENYLSKNLGDLAYSKIGMNEDIFPEEIRDDMTVIRYVSAYHPPRLIDGYRWLMFLEVEYEKEAYEKEINRLNKLGEENIQSTYGPYEFQEDYELLAIESSDKNGLIYALTDDEQKIVYVEMISYDGSVYGKQFYRMRVPAKFLPVGY